MHAHPGMHMQQASAAHLISAPLSMYSFLLPLPLFSHVLPTRTAGLISTTYSCTLPAALHRASTRSAKPLVQGCYWLNFFLLQCYGKGMGRAGQGMGRAKGRLKSLKVRPTHRYFSLQRERTHTARLETHMTQQAGMHFIFRTFAENFLLQKQDAPKKKLFLCFFFGR